jgi:hypothetical protein
MASFEIGSSGEVKWLQLISKQIIQLTGTISAGGGGGGGGGLTLTQLPNITLIAANWVLNAGLYEYNYADPNITAASVVDVIPDNSSVSTVFSAQVLPKTVSSAGSVKMYANYPPNGDIIVTINIYK